MNAPSIETLVVAYREAAGRHGRAKTSQTANKAAEELAATYRKIREQGHDAMARLLPLLADQDPSVRCWAAAHALEFAPEQGEAVLAELSGGPPGPIRANATMTLREWRAGHLRFP